MDMIFPPWLRISGGRYDFLSNTAASGSIFTGATRSVGRTGDRVKVAINTQNASDRETDPNRPLLKAIRAGLRGQANRIWYTDPAYRPRGSFPATELLTNNTFANGTTNWAALNSSSALSVADRKLRATFNNAGLGMAITTSSALTSLVQYAPYALRFMAEPGRGTESGPSILRLGATPGATEFLSSTPTGVGLLTAAGVPYSVASVYPTVGLTPANPLAGDYWTLPYISLARCAEVDNGPNLLLQSDEFDTSWTTMQATVDDQITAAPDGSTAADALEENTTNSAHTVGQTVTVAAATGDYWFGACIKAGTRGFCFLQMGVTSSISAYFNLTTGASGGTSVGAAWSSLRTFSVDLGNGWWYVGILARKISADTSLTVSIGSATAIGTGSYVGVNGADAIYMWHATLSQSSVPTRGRNTSTTALPSGFSQTGPGYYIKGLPASTNGLLLYGDWVQIGSQLCMVTAALNSDAAGLGYLQLAYPPRTAPADNAPVIIHQPMSRFILTGNEGGWDDSPGVFSSFDFDMVEALDQ